MLDQPRVALVHDYINQWGGAEQVLQSLHLSYPSAPIYTLFYDSDLRTDLAYQNLLRGRTFNTKINTSGLQRLPPWLRGKRAFLPIYPTAFENFELSAYDVVISDSSAFAKGVLTRPGTAHVCYCHSPTRYLWDAHASYLKEFGLSGWRGVLIEPLLNYLRVWDYWAADRVDVFVANSENVKARIEKFYHRPAEVIYPPVDVLSKAAEIPQGQVQRTPVLTYASEQEKRPYYLIVGRLSAYKKIELAIEACNRLQVPLVIVGTGREEERLRELAWGTVSFVSQIARAELEQYYRGAKALLMPGLEDFGMVMVEAMAFGKPVIAFRGGGALEIVRPGVNGEFFSTPFVRSLMDAIRVFEARWEENYYQPQEIFASVAQFDSRHFQTRMMAVVARAREEALVLA